MENWQVQSGACMTSHNEQGYMHQLVLGQAWGQSMGLRSLARWKLQGTCQYFSAMTPTLGLAICTGRSSH